MSLSCYIYISASLGNYGIKIISGKEISVDNMKANEEGVQQPIKPVYEQDQTFLHLQEDIPFAPISLVDDHQGINAGSGGGCGGCSEKINLNVEGGGHGEGSSSKAKDFDLNLPPLDSSFKNMELDWIDESLRLEIEEYRKTL